MENYSLLAKADHITSIHYYNKLMQKCRCPHFHNMKIIFDATMRNGGH